MTFSMTCREPARYKLNGGSRVFIFRCNLLLTRGANCQEEVCLQKGIVESYVTSEVGVVVFAKQQEQKLNFRL